METATDIEGYTEIAMGLQSGTNANNGAFTGNAPVQNHSAVIFYTHDVQDEEASAREGRPIFKSKDYIQIMVPGDKSNIIRRPVRMGHTQKHDNIRYAPQYDAFKQKREQRPDGTPLAAWPAMSTAQVKELEYLNIFTVEQLADIADSLVARHTGLTKLKNLANVFLKRADGTKEASRLTSELDKRDKEISALQQQMNDMAAEMASLKTSSVVHAVPAPIMAAQVVPAPPEIESSLADVDEDLYGDDDVDDILDSVEEIKPVKKTRARKVRK